MCCVIYNETKNLHDLQGSRQGFPMKVLVNNEEKDYEEGVTLDILVRDYKGNQKVSHVGALVNNKMIRPASYQQTVIHENDIVSIRRFAAGG